MKRFFRILWLKAYIKRCLRIVELKASGDWFVVIFPATKDEGYGIYHPWRIHYKATNSTYGEAKLRADHYNEYLIEDNSLDR